MPCPPRFYRAGEHSAIKSASLLSVGLMPVIGMVVTVAMLAGMFF